MPSILPGPDEAGQAILDIPHPALIGKGGPSSLVDGFMKEWGLPLTAVAIPITLPDGTMLSVPGLLDALSPSATLQDVQGNRYGFANLISSFSQQDIDIYLTLDPTAHFINAPQLQIVDTQASTSRQICTTKSMSRQVLGAIMSEAIRVATQACADGGGKLAGVALDVTNLLPMGTDQELIETTCFCSDCMEYGSSDFQAVKADTKAFNLGLKDSGSGIAYIEEIRFDTSADDLLTLSESRGFTKPNSNRGEALARADKLLAYMRKRHRLVVDSLETIFELGTAGHDDVRRILICENAEYMWTSGLFLRKLDGEARMSPSGLKELWIDPSGTGLSGLERLNYQSYLWRRSRYMIGDFFTTLDSFSDPGARATTGAGKLDEQLAKALLRRKMMRAVGSSLSKPSQLVFLGDSSEAMGGRRGFVSVLFDLERGEALLDQTMIADGLQ